MRKFLAFAILALSLVCYSKVFADQPGVDPCALSTNAKSSASVSAVTAATKIVSGISGKSIYVCGITDANGGTGSTTEQWSYGTGTACATGPINLTGAMAEVNSSVHSWGSGAATLFQAAQGNDLCVTPAGTSPSLSGVVTYVQL